MLADSDGSDLPEESQVVTEGKLGRSSPGTTGRRWIAQDLLYERVNRQGGDEYESPNRRYYYPSSHPEEKQERPPRPSARLVYGLEVDQVLRTRAEEQPLRLAIHSVAANSVVVCRTN